MDSRLTSLAAILEQNNVLLRMILRGMSDQHLRTPAMTGTNSVTWLLGHVAGSRYLSTIYNDDWMRRHGFLEEVGQDR